MPSTMPSSSLARSTRTPWTTRRSSRKGGKLTMPVLALGAEKSFGPGRRRAAVCCQQCERGNRSYSGHWIMEENPQATIKLVTEFLAK